MEVLFSRTAGQGRAKAYIKQSIENGAFPHALLAHGEKGLGQHAFISDITDILLCVSGETRPCRRCPRCLEQLNQNRDNVIRLFPLSEANQKNREARAKNVLKTTESFLESPYRLAPSVREHISIDQVRDLRERFVYSEENSRNRVVAIYLAEKLQAPAANALLKILEEPSENTYFLLSCENREFLLPTIISRCVGVSLTRLTEAEMNEFAKSSSTEQMEGGFEGLIPFSAGSPGQFLSLAEENGQSLLKLAHAYLHCLLQRDWLSLSRLIESQNSFKETDSCLTILQLALETIRLYAFPRNAEGATTEQPGNGNSSALAENLSAVGDIEPTITYIQNCVEGVSHYCRPQISLMGNFFELAEQR